MLRLNKISKDYVSGEFKVPALKEVSLNFRENEFVSILGQSGCGKTTLLNIIGGLDRYTSGDLIIAGKSTKEYNDKDWDSYRNHTIGFVFQNYNLIMHLSILDNVEMALILAGFDAKTRKQKAIDALKSVGLGEHIYKKPNQLSGGRMQRVAIARAIVNNPKIILADEPTGALDTETSIQIMEILKDLSKDRLVIMVTHNPELANKYSTRIVTLLDGVVREDTNPFSDEEEKQEIIAKTSEKVKDNENKNNTKTKENSGHITKAEKTSMSFFTALKLSLQNLRTKKVRTILTAIAGSIGIIGVALILALSSGFQAYVDKMQMDTLSSYPLTIEKSATDMKAVSDSFSIRETNTNSEEGKVYINKVMQKLLSMQKNNNITQEYIDNVVKTIDSSLYYDIQYKNGLDFNIYKKQGFVYQNANAVNSMMESNGGNSGMSAMTSLIELELWSQLLENKNYIFDQYDLVYGNYPKDPTEETIDSVHEVVLVLQKNGKISDIVLQLLGLTVPSDRDYFEYEELIGEEFKLILNDDLYSFDDESQSYSANKVTATIYNRGLTLKIVGILKLNEDTNTGSISGSMGYLPSLANYVLSKQMDSEIVAYQKAHPNISAFTGEPFATEEGQAKIEYEKLISKLGGNELPTKISIYPIDFASKETIKAHLNAYNNKQASDEDKVYYTDVMELMVSTLNTVISAISYVLIAFTSISLVVSSLMIGIITYVSVLERIKEIGILRSIGARKKDISRVFNAETLIIGFCAGFIGVVVTLILSIPINIILNALVDISGIASLPPLSALVLILISMGLTLVAGFIPAKIAAKKDPVLALRSE